MNEPRLCFGEGDMRPFSSLTDQQLAFCAVPQGSWQPEPDDLPDQQAIYCAIAAYMLQERQR